MARRPNYYREYYARVGRERRRRRAVTQAEEDRMMIAQLEDDGYRAPHRRIYDRTPPDAASLRLRREADWRSLGYDLSHRPPVVRERESAMIAT